jgi:acyl carrier protein
MDVANIYPRVAKIVSDVLAIDESEIALNKRLMTDLGAESIDFLDLIFQLEREFGVKIPRGQIEKEVRGELPEDQFEKNGMITVEGMKVLKDYLTEVPSEYFKPNLKVSEIPLLFTVETFCKLVVHAKNKQLATTSA